MTSSDYPYGCGGRSYASVYQEAAAGLVHPYTAHHMAATATAAAITTVDNGARSSGRRKKKPANLIGSGSQASHQHESPQQVHTLFAFMKFCVFFLSNLLTF